MTRRDMLITQLEEDHRTALIDHVIPNTLLNVAMALNDMIYTSCERMECKEEHDVYGFDNFSLKNSLDASEEKDHTVYSNDRSSRNETKVSSPDTRTNNYPSVDKTTSNHEDYLISLQQKRKESWESNTVETIYRERKPLNDSLPSALAHSCCSHDQNQVASREIRKSVVSPKILSSDQLRTEEKKQREIKETQSQRKYDKQIQVEDIPTETKLDSKQTRSEVPDLGDGDIELKDSQLVITKKTEGSDTSKTKKTNIPRSHHNPVSQHSEKNRPSGNSIRFLKKILSKYIRPVKFENASLPFLSPNRDMEGPTNEKIQSIRSCRTFVVDEDEVAKKEDKYSGRSGSFRLKCIDRNQSIIETENSGRTHKILGEISGHHRRPKKDGRGFFLSSKSVRNEHTNTENVNINFGEETLKQTSTESSSSMNETLTHVFLAPNKEGQEIALPDGDYYYDDPAQVYSLLTMPSFGTFDPIIDTINRMDEVRFQKEIVPHERHQYKTS